MKEHLEGATYSLDYLSKKYKSIVEAGKIFSSDFLADIASSKSNDEIHEMLNVIGNFYYQKPDEILSL